jgi:carboxymethylenebutenolidase
LHLADVPPAAQHRAGSANAVGGTVTDIETRTVRCAGGLPAFLAMPAVNGSGKIAAVVLMHERYGLVKHTRDLAERFARDGFACLAPDFFYKHPDQDALHRGDAGYSLKDREAIDYLDGAVAELLAMPQIDSGKIAIKGVCQTGRHPLVFAAEGNAKNIAAALVWYGAANAREWEPNDRYMKPLDDMLARVGCPVLGIFGEADHLISLADVRRFRDSLERHDKSYTIKVFAGAPHGWLNDTMPGRYRRDAAEAAWALQLGFLRRIFAPGFDRARRLQAYECDHAADYDFSKNVRME